MTKHHTMMTYSGHGDKLHTYLILAIGMLTAMLQIPLVTRLVGTLNL